MSRQQWSPIADYETDPQELSDKELRALSGVWVDHRATLGDSDSISVFTERLKREWAIETGLIEGLYTLDRGITELMIEHGVNAAQIPHTAGENTVSMIGDQEDAINSVFAFVKGDRRLSTSYLKELHSLFTSNQEFAEGRDQFGKKTKVRLIHGDYKKFPNNPTHPDATVHSYCPPEHVAAEMDRLIELHFSHVDVEPEVEAAWLHHRFAQIHPFQDGNGRIARALATLVFIKTDWLPLVVRNKDREQYIDALELADHGDLKPLVSFFASQQREEFINAIGISRDIKQVARVDASIKAIGQRLAQRRDAMVQEWEAAVSTARYLHRIAQEKLGEVGLSLQEEMKDYDFTFFVDDEADGGSRSHYFKRQIVSTAGTLKYYANIGHYRSWVRLVAKDRNQGNILISFHCIGHEFKGVLACSGTWFQRVRTDDEVDETGSETPLSTQVFQFNYKEDQEDVQNRFRNWLELVIVRGLALWESDL